MTKMSLVFKWPRFGLRDWVNAGKQLIYRTVLKYDGMDLF